MRDAAWTISAASAGVIGLMFWLHWRRSHDLFFLHFAAAFWLIAASSVLLLALPGGTESKPSAYILRLLAFVLIMSAVINKNRQRRKVTGHLESITQPDRDR